MPLHMNVSGDIHSHPAIDASLSLSMIAVSCHQCQDGSIRLVGGNSSYEGRIEVCERGCWGPVCIGDGGWSSIEAAVACKQLQMDSQGKAFGI